MQNSPQHEQSNVFPPSKKRKRKRMSILAQYIVETVKMAKVRAARGSNPQPLVNNEREPKTNALPLRQPPE
jgi:hypothetical protein